MKKIKYEIGQNVWIIDKREMIMVKELTIKSVQISKNYVNTYEFDNYNFSRGEHNIYTDEDKVVEAAKREVKQLAEKNTEGLDKKQQPYFYTQRLNL